MPPSYFSCAHYTRVPDGPCLHPTSVVLTTRECLMVHASIPLQLCSLPDGHASILLQVVLTTRECLMVHASILLQVVLTTHECLMVHASILLQLCSLHASA
jgi:hypothetical protein